MIDELGFEGLFTAEGEAWRRQRRPAVTALNADALRSYHHVVATSVDRLHLRLLALAAGGAPVDLLPLFQSFATETVCALVLGHRPDLLGSGVDDLQPHFARMLDRAAARMTSPVPYWRVVQLPADRAAHRSMQALDTAVADFVARARTRRARQASWEPQTLLDHMIASRDLYSDAEIAGNVRTMLLAGEDTTATGLSWAAAYAATRPDVRDRLRAEAEHVLGERPVADHETAMRLEYADAVVREAIRLRSPVPVLGLEPTCDVDLLGYAVPAGTPLLLLIRHVSAHVDGSPGARDFDPDRWLASTARAKGFLPFGAGPRVCPGRGLACLEAKTALAMLLHCFDLTPDPAAPEVRERFGMTTAPDAVRVILRERTTVGAP